MQVSGNHLTVRRHFALLGLERKGGDIIAQNEYAYSIKGGKP